ncbi:hypothetical protein NQ318_023454 [Aromia moschata]|uniref:BPTI/Kunitz inhibitor domain-containing protein n=1 Tax=Aromia moschata TaxID=1265417 RepID=A0AAV8YNE6_9CUCU|nr:hypothetical protein NQ318_023454 [Aromia moschata]
MSRLSEIILLFFVLYVFSSSGSPVGQPTESFQESDCYKPVEDDEDACRALISVYKWNAEKQKCEKDYYGGCNKTKNNFITLEECEKIAKKICKGKH